MSDKTTNKKTTGKVVKITTNVERRATVAAQRALAEAAVARAMDADIVGAEVGDGAETVCKNGVCEVLWKPQRPAA